MSKRHDVYKAICRERRFQDKVWGHMHDKMSVQGWILIMDEELNEAKKDWVKTGLDDLALREILQVVAVGFACLERNKIVERALPCFTEDDDDDGL